MRNDPARLAELRRLLILDSTAERAYDDITRLLASTFEVPITIVAHDPAVMASIASWHWQSGLLPDANAPLWQMDAFRDRFLTAFGPHAASSGIRVPAASH